MPPRAVSKIPHLEGLRGAAAVQVAIFHAVIFYFPAWFFASAPAGALANHVAFSPLRFVFDGNFSVYIFFVLSGYVLTAPYSDPRRRPLSIAAGRAVRLLIPTICAAVFGSVLAVLFINLTQEVTIPAWTIGSVGWWQTDVTATGILDHAIRVALIGYDQGAALFRSFGPPFREASNAPLWTMSVELQGSMLVLVLARLSSRWLVWPALMISIAVTWETCFLCFVIGHIISRYALDQRLITIPYVGPPLIAAAIGLSYVSSLSTAELITIPVVDPTLLRTAAAAALFLGICASPAVRSAMGSPAMVRLGAWSFPLYLVHWPLLAFAGAAVAALIEPHWPLAARPAGVATAAIATIGCAAIFLRIDRRAQAAAAVITKHRPRQSGWWSTATSG